MERDAVSEDDSTARREGSQDREGQAQPSHDPAAALDRC